VRPTWRPDKALIIDQPAAFAAWLEALENASGISISTLSDLMQALQNRHDFFASRGCRLSDRGVDTIWAEDCTESEAASIFAKARAGGSVTPDEAVRYKSYLLHELVVMDAAKGWTMQIHYGAIRNNNTRMKKLLGPDCGFDSIGDLPPDKQESFRQILNAVGPMIQPQNEQQPAASNVAG
jgi:glucuronate isomerase